MNDECYDELFHADEEACLVTMQTIVDDESYDNGDDREYGDFDDE